jgi:hypothetical protein
MTMMMGIAVATAQIGGTIPGMIWIVVVNGI